MHTNAKILPLNSSDHYLHLAEKFLSTQNTEDALTYIDLAIVIAEEKLEYICYKLKILYTLGHVNEYIRFFINHIIYLFNKLPLKDFCFFLGCYQQCNKFYSKYLRAILQECQVPSVIAEIYEDVLEDTKFNFKEMAIENFVFHEFRFALDYAELALKEYEDFDETIKEILLIKCRCLEKLQETRKCIDSYNYFLALFPDQEDAYRELGDILFLNNEMKSALLNYKKALSLTSVPNLYYLNIANCYFQLKKYKKAIKFYNLANEQKLPSIYSYIGDCYLLSNRVIMGRWYYFKAKFHRPKKEDI
ncbi:MAG: hypothetical protein ATN32_06935 [Candidatus Epulonipiscium fishelsonii]|nr:MAG: hypothetical protein ATN32_06935 [Epulopiscium sp. AS2M-Bin002]